MEDIKKFNERLAQDLVDLEFTDERLDVIKTLIRKRVNAMDNARKTRADLLAIKEAICKLPYVKGVRHSVKYTLTLEVHRALIEEAQYLRHQYLDVANDLAKFCLSRYKAAKVTREEIVTQYAILKIADTRLYSESERFERWDKLAKYKQLHTRYGNVITTYREILQLLTEAGAGAVPNTPVEPAKHFIDGIVRAAKELCTGLIDVCKGMPEEKSQESTEGPETPSSNKTDDPVNHPVHYTSHPSGVECIDITRHFDFAVGNAIKYLWRCGLKRGSDTDVQDLEKARWYINDKLKQLKDE